MHVTIIYLCTTSHLYKSCMERTERFMHETGEVLDSFRILFGNLTGFGQGRVAYTKLVLKSNTLVGQNRQSEKHKTPFLL